MLEHKGRWAVLAWAAICAASCALQIPPCAQGAPEPVHLKVVARVNEPYCFRSNGTATGIDPELLQLICESRGWTYEIEWAPFPDVLQRVRDGRADLAIGGIYATPERKKDILFSAAYMRSGLVLVSPQAAPVKSLGGLEGLRVGAKRASMASALARSFRDTRGMHLVVLDFEDTAGCFDALKRRQVDGAFNDYLNTLHTIDAHYAGELVVARSFGGPLYLSREDIAFPVRKGMEGTLAELDKALAELKSSGALSALRAKWIPVEPPPDWQRLAAGLGAVLLLGLLVFGATAWVNRSRYRLKVAQASERRTRDLIEQSPVGILLQRDGKILYANEAVVRMFGYAAQADLVGRDLKDLLATGERESSRSPRPGDAPSGRFDCLGVRQGGELFSMSMRPTEVHLLDGPATLYYLEDVTERRRYQQALRKSEKDYRGLFENAHDAIVIFDPEDERILDVNRAACEMYGYSRSDLKAMSLEALSEAIEQGKERIRETLERGSCRGFQTVHYRRDGTRLHLEVNASVVEFKGAKAILSIHRDVTARVRMIEALERSERDYRGLFEKAHDAILLVDLETLAILDANAAASLAYGLSRSELSKLTLRDLVADTGRFEDRLAEVRREGRFPEIFETVHRGREGQDIHFEVKASPIEYMGRSAILSIQRDITARRKAEEALRQSESRYRSLLDSANDAIFIADARTGSIVDANRRAVEMAGRPLEELRRMNQSELHPAQERDRYAEIFRSHARAGSAMEHALQVVRPDGTRAWVDVSANVVEVGGRPFVQGIFRDVTERYKAEEILRESERRFRSLIENSSDSVFIVTPEGHFRYASPSVFRMTGYRAEELVGRPAFDFVAPEDEPYLRTVLQQAIDNPGRTLPPFEYRAPHKAGGWLTLSGVLINLVQDPAVNGIVVNIRDVTEQRLAEAAIRESEERFRTLAETTTAGILIFQGEVIRYANSAVCEITGYSGPELLEKRFWELAHPDFQELVRSRGMARQRGEAAPAHYELKILRRHGEERWIELRAGMARFEGRPAGIITAFDITERKRAEEALRESEEKLRLIIDNVHEIIYSVTLDAGPLTSSSTFVSGRIEAILGYTPADFLAKPDLFFTILHPDDAKAVGEKMTAILDSGRPGSREYRLRHKVTGEYLWMEDWVVPIRDAEGRVTGFQGVARDVTERKLAQGRLAESERRFRAVFESASDAFLLGVGGVIVDCNHHAEELFAGRREDILGRQPCDLAPILQPGGRDSHELAAERLSAAMGGRPQSFDYQFARFDGTPFDAEVNISRIDVGGEAMSLVVVRDVTDRKRAESALRQSEDMLRLIVNNIPEIVYSGRIEGDPPRGIPTFVSRQAEEILGFTPAEFTTAPELFWGAVHPEDRDLVRASFDEAFASKAAVTMEYRARHRRTGSYVWMEDRVVPLFDEEGRAAGFQGVARDVTERRRAEGQLARKNRELVALVSSAQAAAGFLDLEKAASAICQAAVDAYAFRMAWIGLVVPESVEVKVLASAGHDEGYTAGVHVRWDLSPQAMGPTGRCIKSRKPVVMNVQEPDFAPWRERAEKRGYHTILGLPLIHEDTVRGALTLYSSDPDAFSPDAISVLEVFARQTTMAVVNAGLYEEARRIIGELVAAEEAQRRHLAELQKSQEALRESEHRFRDLAENTSDWIWEVDADMRYTYSSPTVAQILGYAPEEILGRTPYDLMPPEEAERLRPLVGEMAKAPRPFHALENANLHRDGSVRYLETSGVPLFTPEGRLAGFRGIDRDVTERQKVFDALRQSEEEFRRIFDLSPVGAAMVDMDRHFLRCNEAFCRFLGYREDEILGRTFLEFTYPEDREVGFAQLARLAVGEAEVAQFQKRYVRKDGALVTGELTVRLVPETRSTPRHHLTIMQDITDRRKAEDALRDSESRFKDIVEHTTNFFYTHTAQHVLTYVSPQSRHFLGCEPEEAMVRWTEFVTENPINLAGFEATQRAIDTGERQPPYELELMTKDGRRLWVLVNERPVVKGGKTDYIVGALTDITQRKQAEAALVESEGRLRKIIDQSPLSMAIVAMDGTIEYINRRSVDTFGYLPEDIPTMDRWWVQAYPDEGYRKEVVATWMGLVERAIAENHEIEGREYEVTCKDGTVKTMLIFGVPVAEKIFVIFQDVTERKRSEEALRQRLEQSRALVENARTIILQWNSDLAITYWNDFAAEFFGFTREEALGASLLDTVVPRTDTAGRDLEAMIRDIASDVNRYAANINQNATKDGRRVWVAWSNRPLVDARGRVTEILSIGTDITELKQAELALRDTTRSLRQLRAVSPVAIVTLDTKGNVMEWNASAQKRFGWTEEELAGKPCPLVPKSELRSLRTFLASLRIGEAQSYPVARARYKDGRRGPITLTAVPVKGPSGAIEAVLSFVTEEKAD